MNLVEAVGDLFLVIFPITMIIGYIFKKQVKPLKLGNYLQYIVMILVFTMALWAGNIVSSSYVINIVLYAVIYATLSMLTSLILTIPIIRLLKSKQSEIIYTISDNAKISAKLPLKLLLILIVGWVFGYYVKYTTITNYLNYLIIIELLALILIIGLDIGSYINMSFILRGYLGLVIAATSILGSSISGLILHFILNIPLSASLGISMGMGWYSLAGPLLSVKFGPAIGTLAFLANFLREQLTYLLVPSMIIIGFRDLSLVSIGGATSMDDTLPIYRLYMGEMGGFIAFISGFAITMVLPILLSYVTLL
ncbi:MAG: lysine exporter LysO family protein [Vulcanisaeta sp.]